ncbi:MAG: nicotinate phosphoribosyltransferase [Bryobacterales bacterium]|nr:nicotinate phosphoribosyltransferase [Bryobacterales bacterium]MEB2363270.1 nicotinate phosphoribosyltransferase [Bryobacterales bacterium]
MHGLLTDLYQLTMAAGYYQAGKVHEKATFELFVRKLPHNRNFLIAAGLEQAVDYLLNLRFTEEEVGYLRGLSQFAQVPKGFFEALRAFRFTGDVFAVAEGTPMFAGEPLLTVRAPLMEAQIPETYLLATIGFQTMIATKAARMTEAAYGRSVVEFGTRRAHSPEAGVLAGRAAYVGGCVGTSNTLAGFRYNIPVFGTAAHSWVQAFPAELDAFRELQKLLGPATVYLIDTYDTVEGARHAAQLGEPVWGVRLDSGNMTELSQAVRRVLDDAGLKNGKIMVTGDLNEYKILELMAAKAPIDSFGVGTELATSADAPNLGAVYKLVELESNGQKRYTAKFSENKLTMPGAKQVFRFDDHDEIACSWECRGCSSTGPAAQALLRPVIVGGRLVEALPPATAARENACDSLKKLPGVYRRLFAAEEPYPVWYTPALNRLLEQVRKEREGVPA